MFRIRRIVIAMTMAVSLSSALSSCSTVVPHSGTTVNIGQSGAQTPDGKLVNLYTVDFTVDSKTYRELTNTKTDCRGDACKTILGIDTPLATLKPYITKDQLKVMNCLAAESPKPQIRYLLFTAAEFNGTKDPQNGVWYPKQFEASGGKTATVAPSCKITFKSSVTNNDVIIAKG